VLHGRVWAIYTAENGRLNGRTRPCNVSCIRQCTGRIGLCTGQCTGRVHGRFRPCTLAVYTVHCRFRPSTQRVHGRVTARGLGRYNGPCTRPLHGRIQEPSGPCIRQVGLPRRVHVPRRHAAAVCGPCTRPCTRPVYTNMYTALYGTCTRPCTWRVTAVYTARGLNVPSRPVYTAV